MNKSIQKTTQSKVLWRLQKPSQKTNPQKTQD